MVTLDRDTDVNNNHGSTYVVRSDGSSIRRISEGTGKYNLDYFPAVSPDGSRIAYTTARHETRGDYSSWGVTRNFEIEVSDLDGSDRRRLTENGDLDKLPMWSPDGSRIAFVRIDHGITPTRDGGIYTIAPDGSDERAIMEFRIRDWLAGQDIEDRFGNGGLAWSPDGKMLALVANEIEHGRGENGEYSSAKRITRSVLYTVGADGSGLRRLATTSGDYFDVIFGSPAWSPDGETIAFLRTEGGLGMTGLRLYTIRPDGSGLEELALLHENVRAGHSAKHSLSWSPDGASLLLGMGYAIVVNADGSGFREVAWGSGASWSPDGSRIAIVGRPDRDSNHVLYTIAPDGSDQRMLVRREEDGDLVAENGRVNVWPIMLIIVVALAIAGAGALVVIQWGRRKKKQQQTSSLDIRNG